MAFKGIPGLFSVLLAASLAATPALADDGELFEGLTVTPRQSVSVNDRLSVGAPISQGGITVFPIIDHAPVKRAPEDSLVPLHDALAAGTLAVSEMGHGASVARLWVHNAGEQPVLVMAGELLHGGNQDRVITRDVIIPPTDRPVAVEVNCIERGRWDATYGTQRFAYGGRAELGLRRVVEMVGEQEATWATVSALNGSKQRRLAAHGVLDGGLAPSSGTYMASVQSRVVDGQVDKAADEILERLEKIDDAVGIVVAYDGYVVAAELYDDPNLFRRVSRPTIEAVARDGVSIGLLGGDARPGTWLAASFLADSLGEGTVADADPDTWSTVLQDAQGRVVRIASYSR